MSPSSPLIHATSAGGKRNHQKIALSPRFARFVPTFLFLIRMVLRVGQESNLSRVEEAAPGMRGSSLTA